MEEKIDKAIGIVLARIPALTSHSDMQKAAQSAQNLTQAKTQYREIANPTGQFDEELAFLLGRVRSNLGATDLQQVTQAVMHLMFAKSQLDAPVPAKPTKTKTT